MDREQANQALALLRSVVSQARDDTALQNWGVIWMVHSVTNGGGFIATNLLLNYGETRRWPFAALWLAIVSTNFATIALLKRRAGARTFIENQIWAIWTSFIAAVILLSVVNDLLGLPLFGLGPVIAVLSAFGFSMMGAVMGRRWYLGTAIFAASALAMAAVPRWQFLILGAVWSVAQLAGGIWLERDRRRRLATAAPRLV